MTKLLSIRVPNTLMEKLINIEKTEDKTRTAITTSLLEDAIRLRESNQANDHKKPQTPREALQEKCTLDHILEMKYLLAEIARYGYNHEKSLYKEKLNSVDETLAYISKRVKEVVHDTKDTHAI